MSNSKSGLMVLLVGLCLAALPAIAKPYRAMITRTAESTKGGNLEVGLRYQGFLLGTGPTSTLNSSPWSQLAAHARLGITDHLELDTQLEALIRYVPRASTADVYFGDIPVGLQWTFHEGSAGAVGFFARLTLPTGPGGIDILPPTLSDGTLDVEGSFIGELRPTPDFRLMANLGLIHHGTRTSNGASFDVPEALKFAIAGTFNLSEILLLSIEAVGHSFFRRQITPVWDDNQHLIEVIPGLRYEPTPRLVLEAALGISMSPQLQEIHRFRPLLGLTYEFE